MRYHKEDSWKRRTEVVRRSFIWSMLLCLAAVGAIHAEPVTGLSGENHPPGLYGTGGNPARLTTSTRAVLSAKEFDAARRNALQRPPWLEKTGTTQGKGLLSKEVVSLAKAGMITDICRTGGGADIVVAGQNQALTLETDTLHARKTLCRFSYQNEGGVPVAKILHSDDGGVKTYVLSAGWGGPTRVVDPNGKELWRYGDNEYGVTYIAVGDFMSEPGSEEVVFCLSGLGGIRVFTSDGRQVVDYKGANAVNVRCGGIVSPIQSGPEKGEFVFISAKPGLHVLYPSGTSAELVPFCKYDALSVLPSSPVTTGPAILAAAVDRFFLLDPYGKPLACLDASLAEGHSCDLQAVLLRRPGPLQGYLATLLDYGSLWKRSVLQVYDTNGGLFYREVLEGGGAVLFAGTEDAPWDFVVGGMDRLAKFTSKAENQRTLH